MHNMVAENAPFPIRLRLLGTLPLLFFLARFWASYEEGAVANILWLCHFSNLTLAIGLLFSWRFWVRLSAPWLAIGFPLWLWNISVLGIGTLTTLGTHVGGAIIGLIALSQIGIERRTWIYAGGWYFFLQTLSRAVTAPALNVNIAHSYYFGWETMFVNYWLYWLAITLMTLLALWLLNHLFYRLWPAPESSTRTTSITQKTSS